MNVFSGVVTSFKRSWKGEEKFWKVFWIWGVLLYCISLICYITIFVLITSNLISQILGIFYIQLYSYVVPILIIILIRRNIKNIKIKNKIMKILGLVFILIILIPYLSFHVFILGMLPGSLGWALMLGMDYTPIGGMIYIMFILLFYFLFYRNITFQIRLIGDS
jgi:hypothetical protein